MNYVTALIQLPLVMEPGKEKVRTPEDVVRICGDIRELAQETFHVLALSARNCLINRHLVSVGIADASLVHPREVFRAAFSDGTAAVAIALAHNHPSGDPTPSAEDLRITRQLIDAGKILGISVLDHVIIGRQSESSRGFTSLRESGLCQFS